MSLLLLTFFSVYGLMHAYASWRILAAWRPPAWAGVLLAGWMVLMILAPVLVTMLDRRQMFRWANVVAAVGYSWMAVIFWLFILLALTDLWNLGVRGVGLLAPAARAALLPPRPTLLVVFGIVVVAFGWGLAEAENIRVRHVAIDVASLPEGMRTLKLVQISDLHLGVHTGERRLGKVVRHLRRLDPDILVSTGDLVDSSFHNVDSMSELLRGVKPRLGKYAVLGNHEFYAGVDGSIAFHEASGFRVLRGESVAVGRALRIAGVDDPAGRRGGGEDCRDETRALAGEADGAFVVLLKHQPTVSRDSAGRFDLQLSGHTHGGQIFPWHVVTRMTYRYVSGLYHLDDGSLLYVSPGTCGWGPPVRLLAPPEITVFTLRAPRPRPDDPTPASDPTRRHDR